MKTLLLLITIIASGTAWSPQPKTWTPKNPIRSTQPFENTFDPLELSHVVHPKSSDKTIFRTNAALFALPLIATPGVASAASATAVPAAIVAYGHYASLVGIVACLMVERLTIKPNMTPEEEDFVAAGDIGYGIFGALIAYTGYLRTTQYEKGFDFYSHEPLFWLKIAFVGVWGASSFFNTITIIRRAVAKQNGNFEPMGEKLAKRMIQICNAELVAVGIIPLTATFMARGVGYSQEMQWQVEAGLAAVIFAGASFKYVREAFTFEDGVSVLDSSD